MDALRRMAPGPGRRASEPIVLGYVTVIRTTRQVFAHRYLAGRGPVREPRAMLGTVTEWARGG